MNDRRQPDLNDPNCIHKVIHVEASQAAAFRVFTERMSTWWPLSQYKIGHANAVAAVLEPFEGGRWYERGDDGSTCQWGTVLKWDAPSRLVVTWDISADWKYDPELGTELEVRFIPESDHRTRVELEHRRLDRYGARRDEMRTIFDKSGDWGRLLAGFAEVARAQGTSSTA